MQFHTLAAVGITHQKQKLISNVKMTVIVAMGGGLIVANQISASLVDC